MDAAARKGAKRVLVFGATGTIGRAAVRALIARGHTVLCVVRRPVEAHAFPGAQIRIADPGDRATLERVAAQDGPVDAAVACLASRTGLPADAWAVDYGANLNALGAARAAGVGHFILLSAICVQRPRLEFQRAKLAFESALIESGVDYSIVRPTAFFKSLSGQVDRVRRGKPFLIFGDGRATACKPISDADLAEYLVDCLDQTTYRNRILPIGGPGPALSPREMGEGLFRLLGRPVRFRSVPMGLIDAIAGGLGLAARFVPTLAAKAELARIGRYYASESMLVYDTAVGRYDADATPSTGRETLFDFYAKLIAGTVTLDRGAHAVF